MDRSRLLLAAIALSSLAPLGACSKKEQGMTHAPAAKASNLSSSFVGAPPVGTKAKCAVTGEEFTIAADTATATYNGRTYVFCCADCKPSFDKNPEKYALKP